MFKVGDLVRIIHNNKGKMMGHDPAMDKYVNTEARISSVHDGWVTVTGNNWSWAFDSIELIKAAPAAKALPKKELTFRQELTQKCNSSEQGVSFWGWISPRGQKNFCLKKICHADFRYEGTHKKYYENISNHVKNKVIDKEAYKRYVNYILQESPWAHCFVTKKYSVGVVHNIEMNTNVGPSQFMGAITALRMGSEFPEHLSVWNTLVKKHSCSNNEAMLIASLFKGGTNMIEYHGGHWIVGQYANISKVIDFFKNGYKPSKEEPVTKGNNAFGIWKEIYGLEKQFVADIRKLYPDAVVKKVFRAWDSETATHPSREGLIQRTKELYAQA